MKIKLQDPVVIAYDPDVYSSFPDIVQSSTGEYLCIYRVAETHHPITSSIMLLNSRDGIKWEESEFATASLEEDGFVYNCPRINKIQGRLAIISDTKTSTQEGLAKWNTYAWWSNNHGKTWSEEQDILIAGMVPDKIITLKNSLIMGYHLYESKKLVITNAKQRNRMIQMMAESFDEGETWRDRTTIAVSDKHNFCEGSIVKIGDQKLLCYLRDNRSALLRSYFTLSIDDGRQWSKPKQLDIKGHRIVAGIKQKEPYAGMIIGTFRNTVNRTVALFVHNIHNGRMQVFTLDVETRDDLFDYGYTGWCETDDGGLLVVYYICRNNPNPEICTLKVNFD